MLADADQITWACMVCGYERPDARISVYRRPMSRPDDVIPDVRVNVRYCNDRAGCIACATAKGRWTGQPNRDREAQYSPIADAVTWLLEQLYDRQGVALDAASVDSWYSYTDLHKPHHDGGAGLTDFDARYIAANPPAELAVDLLAVIAVVNEHFPSVGHCGVCTKDDAAVGLCRTVRLHAIPYLGRADTPAALADIDAGEAEPKETIGP
jgi:hypothetical protein